jgi:hypothetical protein
MLQTIQIETQPARQSVARLHAQRTARKKPQSKRK